MPVGVVFNNLFIYEMLNFMRLSASCLLYASDESVNACSSDDAYRELPGIE